MALSQPRQGSTIQPRVRVAVVDPYSTGAQIAGVLAERGADTVAVLSSEPPTRRYAPDPAEYLHIHKHRGDEKDTGRTLASLGVTHLIPGSESGVALADQLSALLELTGNDPDTSRLRRDKKAMAAALASAGLAHARTYHARTLAEAREAGALAASLFADQRTDHARRLVEVGDAASAIGRWPVVVKPVASGGSDNVVFAKNLQEVESAAATILATSNVYGEPNDAVICQEYLDGPQYAVNTVSRNARHRIVEVWRDTRTRIAGRLIYDRMDLLPANDPRLPELAAYVGACLDALGIEHGAAHSEVILTSRGPVLVETAGRLQGGDSVALMRAATGSSQTDALLQALLDDPAAADHEPVADYAYVPVTQLFLNAPDGAAIGPASAIQALMSIPGVAGLVSPLRPGAPVNRTIDLLTSPGTVYLADPDAAQIEHAYLQVRTLEARGLYTRAGARTEPVEFGASIGAL